MEISPPKNAATDTFPKNDAFAPFRVEVTVSGNTFAFTDISPESQQRDTSGLEAVIVRGSSTANLYCRVNWVHDEGLTSPGNQLNQVTFCWSAGACKLDQDRVESACNVYNQNGRTADILQAILDDPDLPANLCGCPLNSIRACDPTLPQTPVFEANMVGVCNPDGQGGNLTGLQAEATATTGDNSCIIKQSGGTYYKMCF